MTITDLYNRYRATGYAATIDTPVVASDELFYLALLAFGEQDRVRAAQLAAQAAAREPSDVLYDAAAIYLARTSAGGTANVYMDPEAFSAFIRGGGNVPLYAATSAALRRVYERERTISLLDIGVGDGLALLPALTDTIARVDLVEPSAAMLETTAAQLRNGDRSVAAFHGTLQAFAATQRGTWDIAQATYSLQSLMPDERAPMLAWLRAHGRRVLIVEFDAPDFDEMYAPARVAHVVERFRIGLAEYQGDGGLVAQGFLMPVMFGYFDRTAERTNYEQPIADWAEQLHAAGFAHVTTAELYRYWWAPAYLIEAR